MKKSVSMQILTALAAACALDALAGCAQDPDKERWNETTTAKKEPATKQPLVLTGSRLKVKDRDTSSVTETSDSMSRTMQTGAMPTVR